jgi:hypothetical protein
LAEPLVESEVCSTCRKRPVDLLPTRWRISLEVCVGEEAVDGHRLEALRRMEDENRSVSGEQLGRGRCRDLRPSGSGRQREPHQQEDREETLEPRHT